MHSRPHRCSTNSRPAAVMLASGQRTSIVSSYQNHASPQPRTAASHCGLDNVSNAKKYKKSHSAFWESQDIVHTVTFRGAMVVYNRTITEKIYNKLFHELRDTPSGRWGEKRSRPRSRWRTPRAPLNNLTRSYARKNTFKTRYNNYNFTSSCATIKNPYALGGTPSDRRRRAIPSPGAVKGAPSFTTQTLYRLPQMRKGKYTTKITNKLYKVAFTSKRTLEAKPTKNH